MKWLEAILAAAVSGLTALWPYFKAAFAAAVGYKYRQNEERAEKAERDARDTKDAHQALDAYSKLTDDELSRMLQDAIAERKRNKRL